MKAEKIILSFVAIFVGLIAAGIAFYLYQLTRTIPSEKSKSVSINTKSIPSPTPDNALFITVDSPSDEQVFSKQVIPVSGKTVPGSTIVISTEDGDQVVTPATNGNFTLTQTIPDGTTLIKITSIFPTGEEKTVTRSVTFSTESF
jgi:hypothetical protein